MDDLSNPEVTKRLIRLLRSILDGTQEKLAGEADLDPTSIYRLEAGGSLQARTLEKILAAVKLPRSLVEACLAPAIAAALATRESHSQERFKDLDRAAEAFGRALSDLGRSGLAAFLAVLEDPGQEPWERIGPPSEEDRLAVPDLWTRLAPCNSEDRHFLVETCPEFRNWALVEHICHESEAAASHSAKQALELAGFANSMIRWLPGEDAWKACVEGYALPFVGNAYRVGNDLDKAEDAFARGLRLWAVGATAHPHLLAEWRILDREASLHRDQRRFPEALDRLDRSLATAPREVAGRILLNKAFTLEQMGDPERALDTLRKAAPAVEAGGDVNQIFSLRFNWVVNLCHLDRAKEAAERLPEVRELAARLGKDLHCLRVRWLAARVAAGLGRTDEAVAEVKEVCDAFLDLEMPYDAALAGLNLALYWLEQGQTAAVKELAVGLEKIFTAKGIRREALASLRLFCDTASREAATVALVQQIKAELEKAGRTK